MRAPSVRSSAFGVVFLASAVIGLSGAPGNLPDMDGVPTAEPETVGMSSERLERLDSVMQGYVDRNEVAGVVTLVARRGKVVHFSVRGQRDVENGAPMNHDAIFRIASMTKPVASVALMMLYEEGHFQLRDPISTWLPEFADMQVAIPAPRAGADLDALQAHSRCATDYRAACTHPYGRSGQHLSWPHADRLPGHGGSERGR